MASDMIGHNIGQAPSPEQIKEFLTDTTRDITSRADELLSGAERVPDTIDTDDVAQKATDMAKMLRTAERRADERRKAEKEQFLVAGSAVDGFFKPIIDRLEKARFAVSRKLEEFQTKKAEAERQRREAELKRQREIAEAEAKRAREAEAKAKRERDAARREAEAAKDRAAKAAAAKAPAPAPVAPDPALIAQRAQANTEALLQRKRAQDADVQRARAAKSAGAPLSDMGRVRGDYGGVATLQEFWDIESINVQKIDLEALRPHLSKDDIQAAVGRFAAAAGDRPKLRGVKFFKNKRNPVR